MDLIPLRLENNQRFLRQNGIFVFDLKYPLPWNDLPGFVETKTVEILLPEFYDHVNYVLIQVARTDAVIARIMKPVGTPQLCRQVRFTDPGHPHQRDSLIFPGTKFFETKFQFQLR